MTLLRNILFLSFVLLIFPLLFSKTSKKEPLQLKNGVEIYDTNLSQKGYNLINGCLIIDMKGNKVLEFPGALCNYYENGDIITGIDGKILTLFNKDLSTIWKKDMPESFEGIHHELSITSDSTFILLSSEIDKKKTYMGNPIRNKFSGWSFSNDSMRYDVIYHFNKDGTIFFKWSTNDFSNEIINLVEKERGKTYIDTFKWMLPELTHINSLQPLPSNPYENEFPEFSKGNILFSDIAYKFIGIIDIKTLKIVWSYFQPADGMGQHSARMLPNGNILYFENQIPIENNPNIRYSRVVELNPVTRKIEWEYTGNPLESFYSDFDGNAQRLSNGNTLITVNNLNLLKNKNGKYPNHYVFEVTKDKKIVWKWAPRNIADYNKSTEGFYRILRVTKKEIEKILE